jgi:hypothetical protein
MNLGKVLARAVLLNRPELADLVDIYPLRLRHNFNRATPSDPAFSELYKVKRNFTASEWVRLENEGKKAPEFYDKDKRPIYALKMQAVLKNSRKRFMLFDIMRNLGKERHSNVQFVDKATRSAELFEPHGINFRNGHDMYAVIFEDIAELFPTYRLTAPTLACPRSIGPQLYTSDREGYCLTWSLMYAALRLLNINLNPGVVARYMTQNVKDVLDTRDRFLQYIKEIYMLSPDEFSKMVSAESKLAHPQLFEFAKGGIYDDILDNRANAGCGDRRLFEAATVAQEDDEKKRLNTYARFVRDDKGPVWMQFFKSRGNSRALSELEKVMHRP